MPPFTPTRRMAGNSALAVRFILTSAGIYALVLGIAWLLIRVVPIPKSDAETMFPAIFWGTTVLLAGGSYTLHRGVWFVQREKQRLFRRSLVVSLGLGTLFVALQSFGLVSLFRHQKPSEVETGANAFLTIFAALHAMHFTLALLCLVWVTLKALADRYDHEYYWGVRFCAWLWHGLGIAWCAILMAFLIATA